MKQVLYYLSFYDNTLGPADGFIGIFSTPEKAAEYIDEDLEDFDIEKRSSGGAIVYARLNVMRGCMPPRVYKIRRIFINPET